VAIEMMIVKNIEFEKRKREVRLVCSDLGSGNNVTLEVVVDIGGVAGVG
jgi:hypothetical protein